MMLCLLSGMRLISSMMCPGSRGKNSHTTSSPMPRFIFARSGRPTVFSSVSSGWPRICALWRMSSGMPRKSERTYSLLVVFPPPYSPKSSILPLLSAVSVENSSAELYFARVLPVVTSSSGMLR